MRQLKITKPENTHYNATIYSNHIREQITYLAYIYLPPDTLIF